MGSVLVSTTIWIQALALAALILAGLVFWTYWYHSPLADAEEQGQVLPRHAEALRKLFDNFTAYGFGLLVVALGLGVFSFVM